jgi:hypothetical protein
MCLDISVAADTTSWPRSPLSRISRARESSNRAIPDMMYSPGKRASDLLRSGAPQRCGGFRERGGITANGQAVREIIRSHVVAPSLAGKLSTVSPDQRAVGAAGGIGMFDPEQAPAP